ncbi:MAG: DMT family transporter [Anaerolineae bacterium]|jgi:drug/metabolite transporter (DMT)-like permease|nr:DMT family transporter [Anaerolineae bacterium]
MVKRQTPASATLLGITTLVLGMLIFSLQDIAVKWIGGDYPVLQIVILRSLVALPFAFLFLRAEGLRGLPRTPQLWLEVVRGFLLFLSFTTYMMGLAALPLADMAALRNSGPLMITLLSVAVLRERVSLRHWLALLVGFAGVLLIVQPGSATFNLGSVFALLAALFYAIATIITRQLRATDSSAVMGYYTSLIYVLAGLILAPLALFAGEHPGAHPSIAFLFRPWAMPTLLDGAIMGGLGIVWAIAMLFIARAYSLTQASVAAPFEYTSLLFNLIWGLLLWREVPSALVLAGAVLIVASGIAILAFQRKQQPQPGGR